MSQGSRFQSAPALTVVVRHVTFLSLSISSIVNEVNQSETTHTVNNLK